MSRTATFSITADANSATFRGCVWGRGQGGFPPGPLKNEYTGLPYLEANSQEFVANDMVFLDSGAVTQRLTAGTGPIMGFATTSATNVTTGNAQIGITPVIGGEEYIMNVASSTPANTDKESVALLVGKACNLAQAAVTGTQTWSGTVVDLDTASVPRVVITGLVNDPSITSSTQYIPVYVKFLRTIPGATAYQGLQMDA